MDGPSTASSSKSHNLFQVFLRLRPPHPGTAQQQQQADRFLAVEPSAEDAESDAPTHITLNPPNDRRRAIEKFAFTQVFEEDASQLDVFHCTSVAPLVEGVLAPHGGDGTDALLATLGVTGSGKTHTILGSRTQRGLTQLSLDLIFRSLGENMLDCAMAANLEASISASDASEAAIFSGASFLESVYADFAAPSRQGSRAATPMIVRPPNSHIPSPTLPPPRAGEAPPPFSGPMRIASVRLVQPERFKIPCVFPVTPPRISAASLHCGVRSHRDCLTADGETIVHPRVMTKSRGKHFMITTRSTRQKTTETKIPSPQKGEHNMSQTPRKFLTRPSALPQSPDISGVNVSCDPSAEYCVLISMYEVYNDRIFDLLTPPIKSATTKEYRRRPLLFKSTELSPDRKVVAGLRKIICGSLSQALMVLEAGLHERRVAGTGSNSVSSRSHGFFCVEVKKRPAMHGRRHELPWGGSTLTIVDLAGSERARDAKTAGATLAEAGKINESLMYLGQCLQMQSDAGSTNKPNLVPYRQCKLTELLFSNSFPSPSVSHSQAVRRNPQKAVMIVTADPNGDFNATSQILRYSALAREITVPRIPSITQTILNTAAPPTSTSGRDHQQSAYLSSSPVAYPASPAHSRPFFPPETQRTFSPVSVAASTASADEHRATMELAALEIARLAEEGEYLRGSLAREQDARAAAEAHCVSFEERLLDLEQEIREDCAAEFEARLAVEMARWKAGLQLQQEHGEEHWDRKIEIFSQGVGLASSGQVAADGNENGAAGAGAVAVHEDEDKENVLIEDLEQENERLRREIGVLKRELAGRSPSKRKPLGERDDVLVSSVSPTPTGSAANSPRGSLRGGESLQRKMERLRVADRDSDVGLGASARNVSAGSAPSGSPKKIRKLELRKWDAQQVDDLSDVF